MYVFPPRLLPSNTALTREKSGALIPCREVLSVVVTLTLSSASWLTRQDQIDLRSCPAGLQITFDVFSWPLTLLLREHFVNEIIPGTTIPQRGTSRRRATTQSYPDMSCNTDSLKSRLSVFKAWTVDVQSHSVKNAEDFHTSLCFKINHVHSSATRNQHPEWTW